MATLAQIAADLGHAAGAGGTQLAQAVVRDARSQAEIGAAVRGRGPGLTQLAKRRGGQSGTQTTGSSMPVAAVTTGMAVAAADGGVGLALGSQR